MQLFLFWQSITQDVNSEYFSRHELFSYVFYSLTNHTFYLCDETEQYPNTDSIAE